jgi:hypothetical protein
MTQRSLQRTAAAAALAMVLAFAGPAHAASRHGRTAGPGWMGNALQWWTQIWLGAPSGDGLQAPGLKTGYGIDPNGASSTPQPPATNADKGIGIDPDG